MKDIDQFSKTLLEESKRFLEKSEEDSSEDGKQAYLHACLVLGFSALEAYLNSIADELLVRDDLSLQEQSILSQKEIEFSNGEFELTEKLKFYRIEDRVQYLHRKFARKNLDKSQSWWSELKSGIHLRNQLTHPKESPSINSAQVKNAMVSIISTIDILFQSIYKSEFPAASRGLDSSMTF